MPRITDPKKMREKKEQTKITTFGHSKRIER